MLSSAVSVLYSITRSFFTFCYSTFFGFNTLIRLLFDTLLSGELSSIFTFNYTKPPPTVTVDALYSRGYLLKSHIENSWSQTSVLEDTDRLNWKPRNIDSRLRPPFLLHVNRSERTSTGAVSASDADLIGKAARRSSELVLHQITNVRILEVSQWGFSNAPNQQRL